MQGRIFGPKRDEETEEFRKLDNKELNDLYSLPNIILMIKSGGMGWEGHLVYIGERRGPYRVLVGIPKGKRPLGRQRHRWEDNIKMDLQEVDVEAWTGLLWRENHVNMVPRYCVHFFHLFLR
jgi:hypothetical protein